MDVRLGGRVVEAELVVHLADVAREFSLPTPDELLHPDVIATHQAALVGLLAPRLTLEVDQLPAAPTWSEPELLAARQSLRLRATYPTAAQPHALRVTVKMFPGDRQHQTLLSIHEGGKLVAQELLAGARTSAEHYAQTRQGTVALLSQFARSGVHHILAGPDHLLFLAGLLLSGGSLRQLLLIVTAFAVAHSLTLSLAALSLLSVSAAVVEPAIALSIIYVGADNLLRRRAKDRRAWIAFGFGLVHGLGFAGVLHDVGLPSAAQGAALVAFNVGVELGQVAVVAIAVGVLSAIRARSEAAGRHVVVVGSALVMAAGTYWLLERTL